MEDVIITVESDKLEPDKLRKMIDREECGSIVSFIGLTRGIDNSLKIKELVFDSWEEKLPQVLEEIANKSIAKFGVKKVIISHRVGNVKPKEPLVCIHVASIHRAEGFAACSWVIDELKKQAPLWKKEISEDGIIWKKGLG
jgi:molybdopterin synthase catalytic subunit